MPGLPSLGLLLRSGPCNVCVCAENEHNGMPSGVTMKRMALKWEWLDPYPAPLLTSGLDFLSLSFSTMYNRKTVELTSFH